LIFGDRLKLLGVVERTSLLYSIEGRWHKYTYQDILVRDKTNHDAFWIKDNHLTDLENLPDPAILASEIIENMEVELASLWGVAGVLVALLREVYKEVLLPAILI
jgi:hypothetical protein